MRDDRLRASIHRGLQDELVIGIGELRASDPTTIQNGQGEKEAFLANAGNTPTRNADAFQLPASPYTVMAGTVIPAALVTGINSDLPGQVIASHSRSTTPRPADIS